MREELDPKRQEWGSAWQGLSERLRRLDVACAAIPSEAPDPELFKGITGAATWKPPAATDPALAAEVSIGPVKLRPPREASLDMDSGLDTPKGLSWKYDRLPVTISVQFPARERARATKAVGHHPQVPAHRTR